MPNPFDALDAAVSAVVMSAFGESEAATLRPRTRSEYATGDDPARTARPIRGVFTESHGIENLRGAATDATFSGVTRLSVQMAEFFLPAAEVAAVPYAIKQGDALAFPARPGAPVYTVSDIQRADTGDLNLILAISE